MIRRTFLSSLASVSAAPLVNPSSDLGANVQYPEQGFSVRCVDMDNGDAILFESRVPMGMWQAPVSFFLDGEFWNVACSTIEKEEPWVLVVSCRSMAYYREGRHD